MSEPRITKRSRRGLRKGETDWERLDQLSDADIDVAAASDPDAAPIQDADWIKRAEVVLPRKKLVSLRLDQDVLDYFRSTGDRYQSRINAVLRAYVEAQQRRAG